MSEPQVPKIKKVKAPKSEVEKPVKKSKKVKTAAVEDVAAPSAGPVASGSLFGGNVDNTLSDIFAKSAAYAAIPAPIHPPAPLPAPTSTRDAPPHLESDPSASTSDKKRKREPAAPVPGARKAGKKARPAKPMSGKAGAVDEVEDAGEGSEDEDDARIEEAYEGRKAAPPAVMEGDEMDVQEGAETTEGVKKSAPKQKKDKGRKKVKYTPADESPEDLNRRTLFVGNLPLTILTSKPLLRSLHTHLLSFAPSASIESVRFRSIPFAQPTAELPVDEKDGGEGEEERRRVRREKERAEKWREAEEEGGQAGKGRGWREDERERRDERSLGEGEKTFLRPGEKRKVAFIKKDFHSEMDSVNAYVVMAHNPPTRSPNVPPILDPFLATTQIISSGNLSLFQSRTLRLDTVRSSLSSLTAAAKESGISELPAKREAWTKGVDVKCSLFVGNLEYACKEEDVRAFFEALVRGERGERVVLPGEKAGEGKTWVVGVRIIRDKETLLGKGFGYVEFADRESVDEILALPSDKLKFAKRNLRVQSCKTLPAALGGPATSIIKPTVQSGKSSASSGGKPIKTKTLPKIRAVPVKVPKGNPLLGEKIASLSKDERKVVKSTDSDRLARRMAKKQAKVAGMVAAGTRDKVKLDVRKRTVAKVVAKKGRVRSEHAAKKMKGKRD